MLTVTLFCPGECTTICLLASWTDSSCCDEWFSFGRQCIYIYVCVCLCMYCCLSGLQIAFTLMWENSRDMVRHDLWLMTRNEYVSYAKCSARIFCFEVNINARYVLLWAIDLVRYRHHLTWKYFVINLMDYTDSLSYLCILLVSCQYQSINADAILHNHNIQYVPRVVQHLYLMLINCYYDLEMSFDECLILLIFNCTPCLQTILFTNTLIKSLCHCYTHTHILIIALLFL